MLDAAFQEEGKGVVVTLTDRDSTPTLLKTMAITYKDAYTFVEVPPSEAEFLGKFGVAKEDLSQLFVLPASKVRGLWGVWGAGGVRMTNNQPTARRQHKPTNRLPSTVLLNE